MKNLKLIWILLFAIVIGCTQERTRNENEKKALSDNGITQVKIGEDNSGVLTITYSSLSTLENELKTYWKLSKLSNLRIELEGGEYWLRGDGDLLTGGHLDWVLLLENQLDDLVMLGDGGSQSCTSRDCCSGCKLITVSETAGSCDCTTPKTDADCDLLIEKQSCGHSISTGLGLDQDYVDMVKALDAAN